MCFESEVPGVGSRTISYLLFSKSENKSVNINKNMSRYLVIKGSTNISTPLALEDTIFN